MILVCVICMAKRPPLSPLAAEHRTLLETIVSPFVNTMELKACQWRLCADCEPLMKSVHSFQQTAIIGVNNLKKLFLKQIESAKPVVAYVNILSKPTANPFPGITATKDKLKQIRIPIEEIKGIRIPENKLISIRIPKEKLKDVRISKEKLVEFGIPKEKLVPVAAASIPADPLKQELDLKSEPESENDSESTATCGLKNVPSIEPTAYISAPTTDLVKSNYLSIEIPKKELKGTVIPKEELKGTGIPKEKLDGIEIPKELVTVAAASKTADPLADELDLKLEPEYPMESDAERVYDSESTVSCDSNDGLSIEPATTCVSAPSTAQVIPHQSPEPVGSDGKFEVFTHKPQPDPTNYLTSIRWKERDGVRETYKIKVRRKTVRVRVPCPHCEKSMEKSSLKYHIARFHTEQRPCECDVCGKRYRHEVALRSHKYHQHKNNKVDPDAFCVECNLHFRNMTLYKNHLQKTNKHAAPSDFRYKCDVCDRKFINLTSLNRHSAIHTDLVYKCDHCEQTFKTISGRRTHVRFKHEGRVLQRNKLCDYCGRGFKSKTQLSSHMNTHTGARPFVCRLCGADFGHKSALYLHGRYKHKIQKVKKDGRTSRDKDKKESDAGDDNKEKVTKKDKKRKRSQRKREQRKLDSDKNSGDTLMQESSNFLEPSST